MQGSLRHRPWSQWPGFSGPGPGAAGAGPGLPAGCLPDTGPPLGTAAVEEAAFPVPVGQAGVPELVTWVGPGGCGVGT